MCVRLCACGFVGEVVCARLCVCEVLCASLCVLGCVCNKNACARVCATVRERVTYKHVHMCMWLCAHISLSTYAPESIACVFEL